MLTTASHISQTVYVRARLLKIYPPQTGEVDIAIEYPGAYPPVELTVRAIDVLQPKARTVLEPLT